jgi:polyisoprenoid-binding protein YceI
MGIRSAFAFPLAAVLVLAPALRAKTYDAIPGESTLGYRLVHPMHKVHGVSKDFKCTVDLTADTVTSKIHVVADVKTFDSGNSNRDSHAMEVIQARKYPRVEFASDSVRKEGDKYRVAGNLTFHGVTRPVDFLVTPVITPGKVEITGGFSVKLTDFKVDRPSLMFVPVEDNLTITFDLFSKLD